jgi:hypothetical protein
MLTRVLLLTLALTGALGGAAPAQDLAGLLVGRWEGDIQAETGTYARTLVIKSVGAREGGPVLEAEFGGPGEANARPPGALTPVQVAVDTSNREIVLRFATVDHYPVTLTLYRDGKHLIGAVRGRSTVGRGRGGGDFALNLKKVD